MRLEERLLRQEALAVERGQQRLAELRIAGTELGAQVARVLVDDVVDDGDWVQGHGRLP